jgi:hypothetical protein
MEGIIIPKFTETKKIKEMKAINWKLLFLTVSRSGPVLIALSGSGPFAGAMPDHTRRRA